jgi:hypothetical protein
MIAQKIAQPGQLIAPYSTSFNGASGLPIYSHRICFANNIDPCCIGGRCYFSDRFAFRCARVVTAVLSRVSAKPLLLSK